VNWARVAISTTKEKAHRLVTKKMRATSWTMGRSLTKLRVLLCAKVPFLQQILQIDHIHMVSYQQNLARLYIFFLGELFKRIEHKLAMLESEVKVLFWMLIGLHYNM
jgi:hypothetical protein